MSEMVERVQEVLLKSLAAQGLLMITPQFAVVPHGRDIVIDCASLARAAIETMREPNERMCYVGLSEGLSAPTATDLAQAWRAMVDDALKE